MNSYAALIYSGIPARSADAASDGRTLARQCLTQLKEAGDAKRFPPRLLVLLTSPAYLQVQAARQLLGGIKQEFKRDGLADGVALVGSSVAAVFFDNLIHEDGALLICLSSLLLEAKAEAGKHASRDPEAAIDELLTKLDLNDIKKDLNPLSNRLLLTFFPDVNRGAGGSPNYRSDELHWKLWKKTLSRIPIAGGISSVGPPRPHSPTQALQFCNWEVHTDAVVAAQVDSGVPLGVSLCRGLETVREDKAIVRRRVEALSEDGLYIESFVEDPLDKYLENGDGLLLLGEDSKERDLIMAVYDPSPAAGRRFRVTDKVEPGETFRVLRPHPEQLLKMAGNIVQRANERVRVRHPLGCLSLICSAHYRSSRDQVSLYIEQAIKNIEEAFGNTPCVGGFVDGEAGVDETGRSQFGNWSMVGLIVGDEMRDRTPLFRGFKALAKYSQQLTADIPIEEAIAKSLELVYETDFPGVMLSTLLPDQEQDHIIMQQARGSLAGRHPAGKPLPIVIGDPLLQLLTNKQPVFVKEKVAGRRGPSGAEEYVGQYILPLKDLGEEIIAVLHVDLGRVGADSSDVTPVEREVLNSLAAAIAAGINDIFTWRAGQIARELDRGLKESLPAATLEEGLTTFVKVTADAFGADMGHVRIARLPQGPLELRAGVGDYFEAARQYRAAIRLNDVSPTCETFFSGGTTVVNDAWENAAHNRLRETVPHEPLREALREVRSYANTAFKNQEGRTIGTMNLLSKKPWFFTQMHRRSLKALAERIEFLIQHLEQKEQKKKIDEGIEFLRNAAPQLSNLKINDMPGALRDATAGFCEAAGASVASLYIFDKDINKYVLRAQHNWLDNGWVNVARYERDGGWLWNLAQQPVPEPQIFLDECAADQPYAKQMFGDDLGGCATVSAAGLPLTLSGENLGLLVLYRAQTAGPVAKFATINTKDLQEAASSMAALVRILLFSQEKAFGERMQKQFKKLSDIFLREASREVLEEELCKTVTQIFGADVADFYFPPAGNTQELTWVAGYPKLLDRGAASYPAPHKAALSASAKEWPMVLRHGVTGPEEHKEYELVAVDGLVTRLCIPVSVKGARAGAEVGSLTGVLDVVWDGQWRLPGWEAVHHSERQLKIMGSVIGSAYGRYRDTMEKEEARKKEEAREKRDAEKMQVVTNMRLQASHVTGNILNVMKGVPEFIRAHKSAPERASFAQKLEKVIVEGRAMVREILDSAEGMLNFRPHPCSLKDILNEAVESLTAMLYSLEDGQEIKIPVEIDDSIDVYVDSRLTKQVFFNLINNAIQATKRKSPGEAVACPPRVTVSVVADEAEIIIEDKGVGLAPEQIEAAKNGKLKTPGKTGSGVFFSRGSIFRQCGTHDMFPNEYGGITVRVTLPLNQKEETDDN